MKRAIAIDGPNGSGKSTIARRIAQELGFAYVDTGALYRAIGLFCIESGANPDKPGEVEACLPRVSLSVKYEDNSQITYVNDRDASAEIRTQEAARAASKVALVPKIRALVVETARGISANEDVVMDGRDIGTVVLPHAGLKIYLDASLETRTRRRLGELMRDGRPAEYAVVMKEIEERDHRDSTRECAPLRVAEGAVVIDSSHMSPEQVCGVIIEKWRGLGEAHG